jgi:predicted porin
MNKNIKLAVAGAVLALSASANAGIIIPAGDWTLDVNGNVNAFANFIKADHAAGNTVTGGMALSKDATGEKNTQGINTGLLPSWLGFTGKTRQNDVDVEFTISMQPAVSASHATGDQTQNPLWRQNYVSFGDKSWGSIKLGKDIGIFASNAILNDMTLLGVGNAIGAATGSNGNTTHGGIGTGYIYAAWKGQIAYTTPNFNGFQATVGLTNPNQGLTDTQANNTAGNAIFQDRFGLEGQATYTFAGDALNGKVWAGGASYKVKQLAASSLYTESTSSVADLGANVNFGAVGLTGYYYTGEGVGTTTMFGNSHSTTGQKRDSDGGYLQATYTLPIKTKIGVAYGKSSLDLASGEATGSAFVKHNKRITVGAYHPLTKHLNLVAEFNDIEAEAHSGVKQEHTSVSTGAILFF